MHCIGWFTEDIIMSGISGTGFRLSWLKAVFRRWTLHCVCDFSREEADTDCVRFFCADGLQSMDLSSKVCGQWCQTFVLLGSDLPWHRSSGVRLAVMGRRTQRTGWMELRSPEILWTPKPSRTTTGPSNHLSFLCGELLLLTRKACRTKPEAVALQNKFHSHQAAPVKDQQSPDTRWKSDHRKKSTMTPDRKKQHAGQGNGMYYNPWPSI